MRANAARRERLGESERIVEHAKIGVGPVFSDVLVDVLNCWGHHEHDDQVVEVRLHTERCNHHQCIVPPKMHLAFFARSQKTTPKQHRWPRCPFLRQRRRRKLSI